MKVDTKSEERESVKMEYVRIGTALFLIFLSCLSLGEAIFRDSLPIPTKTLREYKIHQLVGSCLYLSVAFLLISA